MAGIMSVLAIDIGGTKFSIAVFEDERIIARESRATERAGGRDWMLDQIAALVRAWKGTYRLDVCGIGFGGPVDFCRQRVALSTHVGGWNDFDLPAFIHSVVSVPILMDNDANVGALG